MEDLQRINIDVPRELWRQLSIRAAEEGKQKREILAAALEAYLRGGKEEK